MDDTISRYFRQQVIVSTDLIPAKIVAMSLFQLSL